MKTILSFCMVLIIMLVACTKDQFVQDENLMLKKAKVPVPMKADFCLTPNPDLGFMLVTQLDGKTPFYLPDGSKIYLPNGGWLSGYATHSGELQMMESAMTAESAIFDPYMKRIIWKTTGKVTAANGDYYFYDAKSFSNPIDGSFTGNVYMRDGVGKFAGATGEVEMVGQGTCWHAEGTITYTR